MILILLRSGCGAVQGVNQVWVPLDSVCSPRRTKLIASALPRMCFYKDPVKLVPPNPSGQLVGRLRTEPTKAKFSLPAFYPLFAHQKPSLGR